MSTIVIAVDGPAGSGKSSVSRAAAAHLGFAFLDSGASYRALTWWLLEKNMIEEPDSEIVASLPLFEYHIGTDPAGYRVSAGGGGVPLTDVTSAIREGKVADAVSRVARIPGVREYMVELYRRLCNQNPMPGIVVEGRDITTVVFPAAPVRVLLTARPEVRAARRAGEQRTNTSHATDISQVGEALAARDAADLKSVDFMVPAPGVELLDTSDLSFQESVAALVALARKAKT